MYFFAFYGPVVTANKYVIRDDLKKIDICYQGGVMWGFRLQAKQNPLILYIIVDCSSRVFFTDED